LGLLKELRYHAQLGLLGKGIGEAFGDAVAEVVEAGVTGYVDERKNGERANGAGGGATRGAATWRSGRERLQHEDQIAEGLEALGGVLLQAMGNEALEVRVGKRGGSSLKVAAKVSPEEEPAKARRPLNIS